VVTEELPEIPEHLKTERAKKGGILSPNQAEAKAIGAVVSDNPPLVLGIFDEVNQRQRFMLELSYGEPLMDWLDHSANILTSLSATRKGRGRSDLIKMFQAINQKLDDGVTSRIKNFISSRVGGE
jgi:hypothetical protein